MSTMNISITNDQAKLVDKLTREYDFANRSELFRAMLRLLYRKPTVLRDAEPLELVEFKKRPISEIKKAFEATGKYNKAFIKDLINGLEQSSLYAGKES